MMLNDYLRPRPRGLYTVTPLVDRPRRRGEFYFVYENNAPQLDMGRTGPFTNLERDRGAIEHMMGLMTHLNMVNQVENTYYGPVVTSFGSICIYLKHGIRVDITLENAIRLINPMGRCKGAIDWHGSTSSIIHSTGRIYQSNTNVQLQSANDRKAKLSNRGVTFKRPGSPVVYLLDMGGVRTTVEKFFDLNYDFTLDVFYEGSSHGRDVVSDCLDAVTTAGHYHHNTWGEVWTVGGVKVSQDDNGEVTVQRDGGRRVMKTSPTRCTISVDTPLVYACASVSPDAHLFAKRGTRSVHMNEQELTAKHGSQSAGLDQNGKLIISQ